MKASLTPSAPSAVASTDRSKSDYNFRMSHRAAKSVEAFLAGKRGDVTEVFAPARLAAFAKAPIIGQLSVGAFPLVGNSMTISLAVVKIVDGRLMLQGNVPSSKPGPVRTFDCGKVE